MDGETERKLAAIILGEAQRLRAQASEEVALRPHIRFRPNSQFLKATVQGIQATNRALDMRDMWEQRERELETERRAQEQPHHRVECKEKREPARQEAPCAREQAEARARAPLDRASTAAQSWGTDSRGGCTKLAAAQGPARPLPQRCRGDVSMAAGSALLGGRQHKEQESDSRLGGSDTKVLSWERARSVQLVVDSDRWMPGDADLAHHSLPDHGLSSGDPRRGRKRGRLGDDTGKGEKAQEREAEPHSGANRGGGAELRHRNAAIAGGSGAKSPSRLLPCHTNRSARGLDTPVPNGGSNRSASLPAENARRAAKGQQAGDRKSSPVDNSEDAELRSFLLARAKKGRGSVGSHTDQAESPVMAGHPMNGPAGAVVGLLLERVREGWEDRIGALGGSGAPWPRGQGEAGQPGSPPGPGTLSSEEASSSSGSGDAGQRGKRERCRRSRDRGASGKKGRGKVKEKREKEKRRKERKEQKRSKKRR